MRRWRDAVQRILRPSHKEEKILYQTHPFGFSITAHPVLSQDTSEIGQVITQRQIVDRSMSGTTLRPNTTAPPASWTKRLTPMNWVSATIPDSGDSITNLGIIYVDLGRFEEGLKEGRETA